MEHLREVRTRLLLDTTAEFRNRMTEIWALREVLRTAEERLRDAEPFYPAVVGPSPASELRA